MGLVILPMWIIGAFVGVLIWRRFCPRKAHPRVYWVGVALIVLAPQWYFLAYGAVDWVRWHERCETMQLVIPPKIHTDVLGIVQGTEVYSDESSDMVRSADIVLFAKISACANAGRSGVVRNGCTLEEVAADTRPNDPLICYKKDGDHIHRIARVSRHRHRCVGEGIPSTRFYTISHVRHELRRRNKVVGEWEAYFLARHGLNLLVGFPHALVCRSGDMSARRIGFGHQLKQRIGDGSHN